MTETRISPPQQPLRERLPKYARYLTKQEAQTTKRIRNNLKAGVSAVTALARDPNRTGDQLIGVYDDTLHQTIDTSAWPLLSTREAQLYLSVHGKFSEGAPDDPHFTREITPTPTQELVRAVHCLALRISTTK